MKTRIKGCEIIISPLFAALIAFMLVCDRTGMMGLSFLSVLIHESGHIFIMYLLKKTPSKIILKPAAVEIIAGRKITTRTGEIMIALGGIMINIGAGMILIVLSIYLGEILLHFAAVNISLAVFSAIPVKGLDGGDIAELILESFLDPVTAQKVLRKISFALAGILVLCGLFLLAVFGGNPSLLLTGFYLIFLLVLSGKKPVQRIF